MNQFKKVLSFVLALMMVVTLIPFATVSAAEGINIALEVSEEEINAGDEFEVTAYLEGNPGVICVQVIIRYDTDNLELVGEWDGEDFYPEVSFPRKWKANFISYGPPGTCIVTYLNATASSEVTEEEYFTAVFKAKDDAYTGDYDLTVEYVPANFFGLGLENVPVTGTQDGVIHVNGRDPEPVCEHEYDNACDADCNLCGEIREVGDHVYTYPCDSSCDICGATREASHDWNDATCTEPKICKICGSEDGEALGHSYDNACDTDCNVCGATREVSHDWNDATCTEPKTCKVCGSVDGEALGHTYANDCDADCDVCGAAREVGDHQWKEGACSVCGVASPSKVTITTQTKTTYAKEGAKLSLKVVAKGEGLKYTWYIKNAGKTSYSKSSVTSATYSTTMSDKVHGRRVYCVITDKYGNKVQSNTALLRRQATITKVPATVEYAAMGKKASIKVTAKGDGLKYQWYFKNNGASKYSKSSVTSSTYSVTMASKVKGRRVYCVVTDKYGKKVQSKTFLIRESVSIKTQPKTVTVAKNKTAKITVKASGDGLKYTWYIKNAGSSKYSKSSVKTASYSVKMTSKVKNRLLYCVVTDKYGNTVKTVTVKLKMK